MSQLLVSRLNAFYGDFQALFDIDLHVDEGEVVAIIGANGAGKSTFLHAIAGSIASAEKSITFAGEQICGLRPWEIVARGIALVPEGRRLFSSLTVEENLMMGAYARKKEALSLAQIYQFFPQLKAKARQSSTSLSGGEQQMVAIGRAMISNPRLLMCDELSLGLAPVVVHDIYERLRRIKDRGVSLIIVEQNIKKALEFADRVYCFQEGRVSLTGPASDLQPQEVSKAYFGLAGAA